MATICNDNEPFGERHPTITITEIDDVRAVEEVFAAYPDFYDVSLALLEWYGCGWASFEMVDSALRAHGMDWPQG